MTGAPVLGIEASNPSAGAAEVALGRIASDGSVRVVDRETLSPSARHDDDLLPAIERLCARAGVRPKELVRVVVSAGPGGFTAVRIAMTVAKTIALASDAELVPVPSWRVAAHGLVEPGMRTVLCMASKREQVFTVLYEAGGSSERVLGSIAASEVAELAPATLIADDRQPAELLAWAARADVPIVPPEFSASRLFACVGGALAVDPAKALPVYPRRPEAVRLWERLHAPENP